MNKSFLLLLFNQSSKLFGILASLMMKICYSQPTFICSKLPIKALEQGVKCVQS